MDITPELDSRLKRIQSIATVIGVVGVAASAFGAMKSPAAFYSSYLLAFIFWLGVTTGPLAFQFVHHLVAGAWSFFTRRMMEAATRLLPFMALAVIPIIVGMPHLYRWLTPEWREEHEHLWFKIHYLSQCGFIGRTVLFFVLWMVLAFILNCWSAKQDTTKDPKYEKYLRKMSGVGLVIYVLTVTFASFDWIMSLEPDWYSSMYGPLFFIGQGLTTITLCIVFMRLLAQHKPFVGLVKPVHFHDLGNLAFAFTILWGYMSIAQYLIIWCANLPEEVVWYMNRNHDEWPWVASCLVLCNFFIPFFILLFRNSKLQSRYLIWVCVWILCMRFVDLYWLIAPTFRKSPLELRWLDLSTVAGIGGIWISLFIWQFRRRPLLPQGDNRFANLFHQQEHGHS